MLLLINITENEIMSNWEKHYGLKPLVTIICTVYNHEESISTAIESFLIQKTKFPFDILVHDDASTDKSAEIIRKYEKLYPHIIKTIYEKENQYSKHDGSIRKIVNSRINGKYVALCEGDDYWVSESKLQCQFEYMESDESCILCTHNTIRHDLLHKKKDKLFTTWNKIRILSAEDVLMGWNVHTSSYFIRTAFYDYTKGLPLVWCGDYALLLYAFSQGTVVFLPNVMSVYNANNADGITWENKKYEYLVQRTTQRIQFLEKYNEYTSFKYYDVITKRILRANYQIVLGRFHNCMMNDFSVKNYRICSSQLRNNPHYKDRFKISNFFTRINMYLLTHSFHYYAIRYGGKKA